MGWTIYIYHVVSIIIVSDLQFCFQWIQQLQIQIQYHNHEQQDTHTPYHEHPLLHNTHLVGTQQQQLLIKQS